MVQAGSVPASRAAGFRQRGPVPAPGRPWPETVSARDAVDGLLQDWDDTVAARLFTPNVDLDRPIAQRRADIALLRERLGKFSADPGRLPEHDSPAHCRWWLSGEHGTSCVQIKLAPLREPRVQQLILALPPAPGSALDQALGLLVDALNEGATTWPAGLIATVNTGQVLRQLRLAAAWAGRCEITSCLAGDGSSSVTAELTGPSGRVHLGVDIAGADGDLQRAEVTLLPPG
jgi:serine-type D-Ala-D-Ala carboxypeptidase/endopeptidase